MQIANERIVVQVTSTQKKNIIATAKKLGINISELMRQAVEGFTPDEDDKDLEAFLIRIEMASQEASNTVDEALAFIVQSNKRLAKLK